MERNERGVRLLFFFFSRGCATPSLCFGLACQADGIDAQSEFRLARLYIGAGNATSWTPAPITRLPSRIDSCTAPLLIDKKKKKKKKRKKIHVSYSSRRPSGGKTMHSSFFFMTGPSHHQDTGTTWTRVSGNPLILQEGKMEEKNLQPLSCSHLLREVCGRVCLREFLLARAVFFFFFFGGLLFLHL